MQENQPLLPQKNTSESYESIVWFKPRDRRASDVAPHCTCLDGEGNASESYVADQLDRMETQIDHIAHEFHRHQITPAGVCTVFLTAVLVLTLGPLVILLLGKYLSNRHFPA